LNNEDLETLIARQQSGRSLDRDFYLDSDVWQADVERVLSKKWHLVGHLAQLPNCGDYFLIELLGESLIVLNDSTGEIRALHNFCRHRGAQICVEASGNRQGFACPYHGWTYALDGSLVSAPLMDDDFDPSTHALQHCHVRVLEGLILINLDAEPEDFDKLFADYQPLLSLYGLADAKIAVQRRYTVAANWKLVVENGLECYHCYGVHPVFAKARSPAQTQLIGADDPDCLPEARDKFAAEFAQWQAALEHLPEIAGSVLDDEEHSDHLRSISRTPLADEYLTESVDGQPVAPLMGQFKEYDMGTTVCLFNPWSWVFMATDHAVIFRWTALGAESTEVEMIWLVAPNAREAVDYDPERLASMQWVTAMEDKEIIERVCKGITSRRYRPGSLSKQEGSVTRFLRWYLGQLAVTA